MTHQLTLPDTHNLCLTSLGTKLYIVATRQRAPRMGGESKIDYYMMEGREGFLEEVIRA